MAIPTNDPRRQEVGTSLQAKPQVQPPDPKALTELGVTNVTGGIPDVIPQWRTGRQSLRIIEQMINNDATINSSLLAVKTPVIGGEYYMEPATANQVDVDAAEFCKHNLFQRMSVDWLEFLDEVEMKLDYGCSVFEKVWEPGFWAPEREAANRKQYVMLQKLAFRPLSSIAQFLYDKNGGPAGIDHTPIDPSPGATGGGANNVEIPIEKLLIFTNNKRGGSVEGRSVLRTAYKHWFYKEGLYKIDAIQKERHGIGVPDIELPPGADAAAENKAEEIGRNLRTNEYAFIVRPAGWIVGFAEVKGNLVNVIESIDHHDLLIARNLLAQFVADSNSRATAGTSMDMLMKSLRHDAERICEVINNHLIPQMVAWNFPTGRFPQMRVKSIGEVKDLQAWSSALSNLAAAKILTPTPELEKWARKTVDAPVTEVDAAGFQQAFSVPTNTPGTPAVDASGKPIPPSGNDGTPKGAQAPNQPGNPPKATPNNKPQTGNVGAPVNAP